MAICQTRFTLGSANDNGNPAASLDPRTRGEHEGYVAGYFIESAINHYNLTGGQDKRLYDAAKKLPIAGWPISGPARKHGSTAIKKWSKPSSVLAVCQTTWKAGPRRRLREAGQVPPGFPPGRLGNTTRATCP